MKKTIFVFVATVIVMIMINIYTVNKAETKIVNEYSAKIESMESQLNEKDAEIEELNDSIYNIVNGEDYNVTINHDNKTVNYKHEKGVFKFFGKSKVTTTEGL